MTDRIDHAAMAASLLDQQGRWPNDRDGVNHEADRAIAEAQVLATLALVEQQRIANLIALGQFRVGVNDLPHLRHLVVEPKNEHDIQPVPEIREALGLK